MANGEVGQLAAQDQAELEAARKIPQLRGVANQAEWLVQAASDSAGHGVESRGNACEAQLIRLVFQ